MKVKINKIIKTMKKNKKTDFCKDIFIIKSFGAPARSRTQNLLVRSQALYPVELQALNYKKKSYIIM